MNEETRAKHRQMLADHKKANPLASHPIVPASLYVRTTNYAKALAQHIANGSKLVPDEVRAERRAICDKCPQRDVKKDECLVCGCKLHNTILGDKLAWASEGCPMGKWKEWKETAPAHCPPPPEADWEPGAVPTTLLLKFSVEKQQDLEICLPRLTTGPVQAWMGQGSAPIHGRSEACGTDKTEWFSPFDWSASVVRVKADGPNQRFHLALDRYTPTARIHLIASKLTLLSLTPFLAVGQGLLTCGTIGTACSPCKGVAGETYGVTVTEFKP